MKSLDAHFKKSGSKQEFGTRYISYLIGLLKTLDSDIIAEMIDVIEGAGERGSTIYFIGNGGSAATATHYANDISIGTRAEGKKLFKAISLTDNLAAITALANDEGYETVFVKQLEPVLTENDVVIALSVSGSSDNVLHALNYAGKKRGCTDWIYRF